MNGIWLSSLCELIHHSNGIDGCSHSGGEVWAGRGGEREGEALRQRKAAQLRTIALIVGCQNDLEGIAWSNAHAAPWCVLNKGLLFERGWRKPHS